MKRAAIINDLSGIGRCSLNVAIPILATLQIQTCPLPTAVLSNQTGFDSFSFLDFTPHMREYYTHWKKLNKTFDAIYSGFLGSKEQVEILIDFIQQFKEKDTLVLIDPVMGDNGKLYAVYDKGYPQIMRKLVELADVITPNITELKLLLGIDLEEMITREQLKGYKKELETLGPNQIIITGMIEQSCMYNIGIDLERDEWYEIPVSYNQKSYSGTGDIFASVICGELMGGKGLKESIELATYFISLAIQETEKYKDWDTRDGILFEKFLKELMKGERG